MQGTIVPHRTMAVLTRGRIDFEKMTLDNNTPRLDCIVIFFSNVLRVVSEEMPDRFESVLRVFENWTDKGTAATDKRAGADINFASPMILDQLFKEIQDALYVN